MALAQVELDAEMFGWDVVPAWERSFGIRFARDDFAQASTVGDIWAVVERHLVALVGENTEGLTTAIRPRHTFYQLRRGLMAQGWERATIAPCTRLQVLLPWHRRRQPWRELRQATALPLPRLQMPALLFAACWAVGAALC
ncbi:hypothetical protein [Hymenobacter daeguensis]